VKVENENFSGNELAYNLVSSDNTAIQVDDSKLPKRDSFGRNITTNVGQYCIGSNIVNPNKSSQRYFCHLSSMFISTKKEVAANISSATLNNHNGNKLCNFLSLKAELSTEEFF